VTALAAAALGASIFLFERRIVAAAFKLMRRG
jgi:hypothetical protein